MGLTHLCAFVKLNESPLFQGVTCSICVTVSLWLVVVTGNCINCTHVVCQATATPTCTIGVVPVCGRPWYPPVWMPALMQINQNCNCSATSCLLWCLGLQEPFTDPDQPTKWSSARTFTTINVVTPWIRSLLFQLTMADPVKVMLVTQLRTGVTMNLNQGYQLLFQCFWN